MIYRYYPEKPISAGVSIVGLETGAKPITGEIVSFLIILNAMPDCD
jgi:hypothetical protein